MALNGSIERRLKCLTISAQMNRRVTKEDPIPSVHRLIWYSSMLEQYAFKGEFKDEDAAIAYQSRQKELAELDEMKVKTTNE